MDLTLIDGVVIAVVAMLVVFIILCILMVILMLFKHFKYLEKALVNDNEQGIALNSKLNLDDENMVVAALVAMIDASNELGKDIRIVSVQEL